jgi:plasmid stabilization system protein ParE
VARTLIVSPRAQRMIAAATRWWRQNRHKAPFALEDDVASVYEMILDHPFAGRAARRTRRKGVRIVHLERVAYDLYYRVEDDSIRILALWHSHRRPPRL